MMLHCVPYVMRLRCVPADSTVLISINTIHNDPELWPEPQAFKPERFLEVSGGPAVRMGCVPAVGVACVLALGGLHDPAVGVAHVLTHVGVAVLDLGVVVVPRQWRLAACS